MKLRTLFSVFMLAAILLASCAPGGQTGGDTIKIAILAPLSGAVPTFGVSTRDGALLASGMPRGVFWARRSRPLSKIANAKPIHP